MRIPTAGLMLAMYASTTGAASIELVRAGTSESAVRADGAVAFVERAGGQVRLAWIARDGRNHVLEAVGVPDTPAWSPAGDVLAYAAMEGENSNLVVQDLATGHVRYIGATPDSEMHPFFSPHGERIVYTRWVTQGRDDGELRLFESDLRPGGAEVPLLRGAAASYGSWSPDGAWLLFWRFAAGSDTNAEIAMARGDGSELRELTQNPAFDGWPSWSPDGRHVAFARERGEEADIWIVSPAGRRECLVAGGSGRKTSPKWSADGAHIYFDRSWGGRTDLMRASVPSDCANAAAG